MLKITIVLESPTLAKSLDALETWGKLIRAAKKKAKLTEKSLQLSSCQVKIGLDGHSKEDLIVLYTQLFGWEAWQKECRAQIQAYGAMAFPEESIQVRFGQEGTLVTRVRNTLHSEGYLFVSQLAHLSDIDLGDIRNIHKKGIELIRTVVPAPPEN